jgi:ABC-type methionine transport system ATPase subunit
MKTHPFLFELKSVSVLRQGKTILDRISIDMDHGTSYAIIGPSGSGKTTLLRLFNLMTIPSEGEVRFRGKPAFAYPLLDYRRLITIVFQEPVLLDGTVEDNLTLPFRLNRWSSENLEASRIDRVLSVCQIDSGFLQENSHVLSGGEKQRVAIARALLLEPEVLLMDEPTSSLDVVTADRVIDGIVQHYPNTTLIIVTHALELIDKIDKKIILKNGIVESCCERLSEAQVREMLQEAS